MKQHWTQIELINSWTLSQYEIEIINKKENKLVYAFKMKYFDIYGSFAYENTEVPIVVLNFIKQQVEIDEDNLSHYPWNNRISRQHNTEIRKFYGFEKFTDDDYRYLGEYLEKNIIIQGTSKGEALTEVLGQLHKKKIVPPTVKELRKYINGVYKKYEESLFNVIVGFLNIKDKKSLDKLATEQEDGSCILSLLRSNTGKISTPTIKEEIAKIEYIKKTGILKKNLLKVVPKKILKKYHDKVSIYKPSDLMSIKAQNSHKYYGLLGCFCSYRGGKTLDTLIEIFIRRFHRIEQKARSKAKQELWNSENENNTLFDSLIDISIDKPDDIIRQAIYPNVGGKEKLEKAKTLRDTSKYRKQLLEYKQLSNFYIYHHKANIFSILQHLEMNSNQSNVVLDTILKVVNKIDDNQYQEEFYPKDHNLPIDGIVLEKDIGVIQTPDGKVIRIYYELAALKKLR